ncbi:MAG: hypothetical protein JRN28_00940, partial [Nitrososphaerota archaeon]|nr:hypothetical protein [Nitrososphaerota archaeon]
MVNSVVSATVTAGCPGTTKWSISNTGYKGTVNCNSNTGCSTATLFSYTAGPQLPVGSYTVAASFDNGHGVRASQASSFQVVNGQSSGVTSIPTGSQSSGVFF